MSGVAIIRNLLYQAVNVPIISGVLPINTALPAIGITQISGKLRDTLAGDELKRLETERVQVTVVAKTYVDQKSYLRTVRNTCKAVEKMIALSSESVTCKSILEEFVGPDFYDSEAGVYMQSVDFMVKYQRSN